MRLSGSTTLPSSDAGMLDRTWKAFYWSTSVLIGALTAADAYVWIGSEAGARLMSAGVCGFVAASVWLIVGSAVYELAAQ
jgi:hypothetical protein